MYDLFVALSLVAVLEGLFLFLAPALWKRLATQLLDLPLARIATVGHVRTWCRVTCVVVVTSLNGGVSGVY